MSQEKSSRARGCICSPSSRSWKDDGVCAECKHTVTESQLQDAIRLALGGMRDVVLWRNNIGHAVMAGGQRVTFGVGGPGGSDLIGMFRGRFLAIEIKTPGGKQSDEQRQFQLLVESREGIYLMPRSVKHALNMLEALRTGSCP